MFDVEDLKPYMWSKEAFENGRLIFHRKKLKDFRVQSFWKTEAIASAQISDISDDSETYLAKLTISDNELKAFGCSCDVFKTEKRVCRHIVALGFKYMEYMEGPDETPVYTSGVARRILGRYISGVGTELEGATSFSNKKEQLYEPELIFNLVNYKTVKERTVFKGNVWIKYGNNRVLVKDLSQFAENVRNNRYFEYSTKVGFYHGIGHFKESSRELVQLICSEIENKAINNVLMGEKDIIGVSPKDILLQGKGIDQLIELHKAYGTELVVNNTSYKISDNRPPINIEIREKGLNGYKLLLEGIENFIRTNDRLYLIIGGTIFICEEEFTSSMGDFLGELCGISGEKSIEIGKKDMAAFYNAVMPIIERYAVVDYGTIELEEFVPWELGLSFYLDYNSDNQVTIKINSSYGDKEFDFITGRNISVSVNRDYFTERRVRDILERYFVKSDQGSYFLEDYEKIYKLLEEGIRELELYGAVELSPQFLKLRIVGEKPMYLKVSNEGGLLSLNMDIGDYTVEELSQVLDAYKEKRGIIPLQDKGLLKLQDSQLEIVAKLMSDLALNIDDIISGNIFIPRYRCLYLDKLAKSSGNIRYDRDEAFKTLVKTVKHAADNEYQVPAVMKQVLRGYQETGYIWLRTMEECGFGGILADDMGLGKTIQIIAFLESMRMEESNRAIIIAPASLVYNWESEICRFAPEMTYLSVVGGKKEREELIERIKQDKSIQVIITSYELLKRDIKLYEDIEFRFQIIDEAQYIKNSNTENAKAVKLLKAQTRFALTGTPIENRLAELWSIFDFIMPGALYTYKAFREEFEGHIVNGDTEVANRLKEIIGPFVMRRLKKDVLKELPDKQEYKTFTRLEGEQHKLYLANMLKLRKEIEHSTLEEFRANKIQIFAQLTRLRQICCDPSLCYEEYEDESSKLQVCMEIIKNGIEGGHKILLFSQFTSMLDIISLRLKEENISHYMLTGKTKKENRFNMVENFNVDDTKVFLISLKAGGTGLNLTGADMVIHYDPWWNKAAEQQATDRTHRIGQKNTVSVFKLIAKDTIEEYILDMQERKLQLAEDILELNTKGIAALTKNDLLRLLS